MRNHLAFDFAFKLRFWLQISHPALGKELFGAFFLCIFVAIGQQPENKPFESVLALDEYGYIKSGEDCLPENAPKGIFTAGDCRTKRIRQITTATADGAVAALAACRFVDDLK